MNGYFWPEDWNAVVSNPEDTVYKAEPIFNWRKPMEAPMPAMQPRDWTTAFQSAAQTKFFGTRIEQRIQGLRSVLYLFTRLEIPLQLSGWKRHGLNPILIVSRASVWNGRFPNGNRPLETAVFSASCQKRFNSGLDDC